MDVKFGQDYSFFYITFFSCRAVPATLTGIRHSTSMPPLTERNWKYHRRHIATQSWYKVCILNHIIFFLAFPRRYIMNPALKWIQEPMPRNDKEERLLTENPSAEA